MEYSEQRVLRLTMILGAIGCAAVLLKWGIRDAVGFLAGSGLSYLSFRSLVRLAARIAESVEPSGKAPASGSAVFLALRYVLIGVAVYVIIGVLRSSPAALISGLLASSVALALDLFWGAVRSK